MWFSVGLRCQCLRNKGVTGKVFEINGLWLRSPPEKERPSVGAGPFVFYVYFYFTGLTGTNTPSFLGLFLADKPLCMCCLVKSGGLDGAIGGLTGYERFYFRSRKRKTWSWSLV